MGNPDAENIFLVNNLEELTCFIHTEIIYSYFVIQKK
jgi:hypothetical protein